MDIKKNKVKKVRSSLLKKISKTTKEWEQEKKEEYEKCGRMNDVEKELLHRQQKIAIISQIITENELSHDVLSELFSPYDKKTYVRFFSNQLINERMYGWHDVFLDKFCTLFKCKPFQLNKHWRHNLTPVPSIFKNNLHLLRLYYNYNRLSLWFEFLWMSDLIRNDSRNVDLEISDSVRVWIDKDGKGDDE